MNVFIHVGMPKTGSTFLQERCFPQLSGVHLVRPEAPGKNDSPTIPDGIAEILFRVVDRGPLLADLNEEKKELDRKLDEIPEDALLISWERLCGSMVFHFYDNAYITRSLGYLFSGAKVIMVIRRQDELLESIYRECLRNYFFPRLDGFLQYTGRGFAEPGTRPFFPSVSPKVLDFSKYLANYADIFGADNVLVLPYELLKVDSEEFLTRLFRFMQVEPSYPDASQVVNRRYSLASCRVAQVLNRFVRVDGRGEPGALPFLPNNPFKNFLATHQPNTGLRYQVLAAVNRRLSLNYFLEHVVDKVLPAPGGLIDDRRRQLIMRLHEESNRKLDEARKLELNRFGYY